jgi:hypothetical integral membrane protein (TIGR02206 family)
MRRPRRETLALHMAGVSVPAAVSEPHHAALRALRKRWPGPRAGLTSGRAPNGAPARRIACRSRRNGRSRATIAHTVEHWSGEHIAVLAATALVAALLAAGARRRGDAWAVLIGRGLAAVILAGFVCDQLTYALRCRWTAEVNLPLHLTDAVTLASVAALWRPESALLVELVYFWALSASLQAVLTPDLGQSFPDLLFFTYFATHSGAVVAACLLVFGSRRTPRPNTVWRAYAITVAFAALAAVGNLLTGGNYMFLRRKPSTGSLLDLMGPWPVYILVAAALGIAHVVGARRSGTPDLAALDTGRDPTARLTELRSRLHCCPKSREARERHDD